MIVSSLAGLAAGATHALSGPDHVAAVLPLAAEAPTRAARLGLTWALGHGLGTIVLAAVVLGLRAQLDLHGIGSTMEVVIGLVLVATGVFGLVRVTRHTHTRTEHHGALALGIGGMHGLAGGAHVLVAMSALALPLSDAALWIGTFVLGAAVAMGAIGVAIQGFGKRASGPLMRRFQIATALFTIVIGAIWAWLAL